MYSRQIRTVSEEGRGHIHKALKGKTYVKGKLGY